MKTEAPNGDDDEPSLDPADWEAFRAIAHRMLDLAIDHVQSAKDRPVWKPVPAAVKQGLAEAPPLEAQGTDRVCEDLLKFVLPYSAGNIHPRFFGWVNGAGTPGGIVADMMTSAINANVGGREQSANYVEQTVIGWFRDIFGLPQSTSGLVVTGTSMATLTALVVARFRHAGEEVRQRGVGDETGVLTAYTSSEAHGSIAKAFDIIGLGRDSLREIAVDEDFRIDVEALERQIAEDRQKGFQPFCVIGTAGSVNTGAIDDLGAIADICEKHDLWFHVDGAFGAVAILSDELRHCLTGMERADSIAFDFHKWMHVSYDAGMILVRDGDLHLRALTLRPDYLAASDRGLAAGNPWFCEYGPEQSRGFRALKVWFTLKEHGLTRIGRMVEENCRQARYLSRLIDRHERLTLLAPVPLNIVCFRYFDSSLTEAELDELNSEIVMDLHEQGIAAPSMTRIDGARAIRVSIVNHRTQLSDLDALVEAVSATAEALLPHRRRLDAVLDN